MTGAEIPIAMAVAPELIGAGAGAAGAGALGAGAGTAAALGTAAAGATPGALAGMGGLLGTTLPSAFGPAAGLASTVLPEAAAAGGGAAAGMGGGTAGLFSAAAPSLTAEAASPLATQLTAAGGMTPSFTEAAAMGAQGNPAGMNIVMGSKDWTAAAPKSSFNSKPLEYGLKAANYMNQQQQPQGGGGMSRPPQSAQAEAMQQILQERLKRGMGGRSNWAGLLGAVIGR